MFHPAKACGEGEAPRGSCDLREPLVCGRGGALGGPWARKGRDRGVHALCLPSAFFPAPEMSKAAGAPGVFTSSLCVCAYRCVCVRRDFPGGNLSPSPAPEPRICGRESAWNPEQVLKRRAPSGGRARPAPRAGGLFGTPLGTAERDERSFHSACQWAVLPPRLLSCRFSKLRTGSSEDAARQGTRAHERALLRPRSPWQGFCPGQTSKGWLTSVCSPLPGRF